METIIYTLKCVKKLLSMFLTSLLSISLANQHLMLQINLPFILIFRLYQCTVFHWKVSWIFLLNVSLYQWFSYFLLYLLPPYLSGHITMKQNKIFIFWWSMQIYFLSLLPWNLPLLWKPLLFFNRIC